MASTSPKHQHRTWARDSYVISTDPSLIPIGKLNAWFASDDIYWANALPEDAMREMLQSSLCFGLYQTKPEQEGNLLSTAASSENNFIGIARCITDFTTFIYLTDVYIEPSSQGNGLGTWMMQCVQEVIESMPHLRRSLLFTGDWKRSVPFYEKILGMQVFESGRGEDGEGRGLAVMMRKGKGYHQRPEFDA
jgi:GNAT superfamily N-acetyltransferase